MHVLDSETRLFDSRQRPVTGDLRLADCALRGRALSARFENPSRLRPSLPSEPQVEDAQADHRRGAGASGTGQLHLRNQCARLTHVSAILHMKGVGTKDPPTGDELVAMLAALANPTRLRVVAVLAGGRDYVSHLARVIGISRPLLHMHLQRLEDAGLIVGSLELSLDGKAMKYFEVADFDIHLTAPTLAAAARTLTQSDPERGPTTQENSL